MKLILSLIITSVMLVASMIDTNEMKMICNIKGYKTELTINECVKSKKRVLQRLLK